jgi:hypothetical protein
MVRLLVTVWLMLASALLSGCSSGQQPDWSQWREYRPAPGEESSPPIKRSSRSQQAASATAQAIPVLGDPESTGTVGRTAGPSAQARDIRPWPKRGTPEWEQLQAEEAQSEKRVRDAIGSICRGC